MKTGLLALLGPLGLIAAGIGTVIALYKMLGDQADNVGMATLGVDNEGNAQYLTTDQTAFAYHTGTARVGGTWSPSNPNSKVYQEAQAADARRNAANYGLTAAISAAAPVQKSQADITVDFKNVPKGTDIDYSTSGEGTNLTLDVETNAPTQ